MKLRFSAAILAAALVWSQASAQTSGSVTNHAFAVGKGAGVTGYTSLLCTSAQLAVGQAAADPICQTITGDVTISAAGVTAIGAGVVHSSMLNADVFSTAHSWSATQSFPNNSLTLAEFPTIGTNTVLGSIAGGTPAALSQAQLTSLCNSFTSSLSGCVSSPGAPTGRVLSDNNTWINQLSANNIWTGDNEFSSGRPWCDVRAKGALGDGSTDDTAAFAACVTEILTTKGYSAGTIFVPPSANAYCLKTTNGVYGNVAIGINTGNTSTGGIIFQGGGIQGTVLSTCGVNQSISRWNNQWIQWRDMSIFGYGSQQTDPVFTGTAPGFPTMYCDTQASESVMRNVYITGGTSALFLACAGYDISNLWASFSYGNGSDTFGIVRTFSAGGSMSHSHLDQAWPFNNTAPAHNSTISAWAATQAYTAGNVVSVTCNTVSFLIQATVSGTSGGSAPNCAPYGANITDGTVTWQLVNRATSYCAQFDGTGTAEVQWSHVDMTCAAAWNLGIIDISAGVPTQLHFTDITPGGGINGIVRIQRGSYVTFTGSEFSGCIISGCAAIGTETNFAGPLVVTGSTFLNSIGYCFNAGGGSNFNFNGNTCISSDTVGFNLPASQSTVIINGNVIIPSSGNAWTFGNGITHAVVQNNVCNAAAISNGTPGSSVSLQSPCY